jgi:SAM-dependent methyltransferase
MGSAEDQAKLWSVGARGWAERFEPNFEPLWHQLMTFALVTKGKRFLDAGCGAGGASVIAAKKGAHVTGLDATPELLAIAAERVPQGRFDQGDLESLPYEDRSFDAIIAANSIQFTYNPAHALRELGRVRARDGVAVVAIFTPKEQNDNTAIFRALSVLSAERPKVGPFALSAPGVLDTAIADANLRIVREEEVPCDFIFASAEEVWRAFSANGATQATIDEKGEAVCRAAVFAACEPFTRTNGVVQLRNRFRCVCLE